MLPISLAEMFGMLCLHQEGLQHYMTDCHDRLSGALWLPVPEQEELGGELVPYLLS